MLYELLLRKTVNQWAFNKIIIIIIIIIIIFVVGKGYQIWTMCMLDMKFDPVKPIPTVTLGKWQGDRYNRVTTIYRSTLQKILGNWKVIRWR